MSTTLTKAGVNIVPLVVIEYSSTRTSGNVLHTVLGRADVDVTFKAAGLREGTLNLLFVSLTAALQAEAMHASIGSITLTSTDLPGIGMKYVPSGNIELTLDTDTSEHWNVFIDFQEIL
jgi:hypothetical protein